MEYLEQIGTEWHEYQGYFVRRELWVGLESDGSYECELDIVGFHPMRHRLVQIETSLDLLSWQEKEEYFRIKFAAGKKYLHRMFGVEPQAHLEQIALVAGDAGVHHTIAGGKLIRLDEMLAEILRHFCTFDIAESAVPEQWPLLRTLQFAAAYRARLAPILTGAAAAEISRAAAT